VTVSRFSRWLRDYYDGIITVAVVVVTLVPRIFNAPPAYSPPVEQALLITMGLLAVTIMRHQARAERADREPSGVRILNRDEIRQEHEQARQQTSFWVFKGGTGTYLRAVTLPRCIENAHREHRPLRVQVEIIDPTNQAVCEYYASLLHARPDGIAEPWTPQRTRNESYATILAASWYQQRHTILRVEVALSATVPSFRWDLTSTCVLITQEDFQPNLMFKPPSPHYNLWTRELDSSFWQARRVPLERAKTVHLADEPTAEQTRRLFEALGMPLPELTSDDEVNEIVRKALHARNPYP
jgi:hypothetical protein